MTFIWGVKPSKYGSKFKFCNVASDEGCFREMLIKRGSFDESGKRRPQNMGLDSYVNDESPIYDRH